MGCRWDGEGQELLIVSCLGTSSQRQKYKKVCVAPCVRRAGPALLYLSAVCCAQKAQKQVVEREGATDSPFLQLLVSLALIVTSAGPSGAPRACVTVTSLGAAAAASRARGVFLVKYDPLCYLSWSHPLCPPRESDSPDGPAAHKLTFHVSLSFSPFPYTRSSSLCEL